VTRSSEDRIYDELLVVLAQQGDRRAASRLAARWHPRLLRTARRLLGDPDAAAEAVQEGWAAIAAGWPRLRDPARFPAWAFGILHRKCADRIRANQKSRAREVTLEDRGAPAAAESRLALAQAFARLGPAHRATALYHFGEGLTLAEIAAITGVPVGTVKSRLFHARQQLKADLKGDLT
jgi:RNA polymerase sigma-70 factor (ECF subfamily)